MGTGDEIKADENSEAASPPPAGADAPPTDAPPTDAPPTDGQRPPSAFTVCELVGIENRPDMPGHLLFMPLPGIFLNAFEQEKAREELEKVAAVLRAVFQEKHKKVFDDYFARLLAIAWGVYSSTGFRPESLTDLTHLRSEIVQRAGGLIKSEYNARLGMAVAKAIGGILPLAIMFQFIVTLVERYGADNAFWTAFGENVKWDHSVSVIHLGALLAASMVGLLFASMSRNLDPTFETLMTPDADLMQPWVRLLFFGIAITVLALIFQLQIVTVSFGESFSTSRISDDFLAALLIGLLLGIGERALPSQVERWSKDLISTARRSDAV